MFPTLVSNDAVLVRPATVNEVRTGDIVVFRRADRKTIIAHRLVSKRQHSQGTVLICRGDGFRRCDPAVPNSALLGKVVSAYREGKPVYSDSIWQHLIDMVMVRVAPLLLRARIAAGGGKRLISRSLSSQQD